MNASAELLDPRGVCTLSPLQLSLDMLANLASRGVSMEKFLRVAGLPLMASGWECINEMRKRAFTNGFKCNCKGGERNGSLRNYSLAEPLTNAAEVGDWDTRLYWDESFEALRLCSTFKPFYNMWKGNSNAYRFSSFIYSRMHYKLRNAT